ncbi:MAG: beta-ketoacyl synthase chain length factor [Bacteroidaceae bacterium]|nr:beta-ketoacyl synthase chain length factor [Bacteroidaceae bacterium]
MTQDKSIKVLSAKQISIQKPLSEEWMESPEIYQDSYVKAIDPDFKQFISAGDARRLGKLLKRALATSLSVLQEGGITNPDAIVTGTGFGSVENTELFLDAMVREGEQMLKPTQFMQSTHNTASSLIGINTHSHGYNSTYTQKGLSFDSALYDAWLQFRLGKINSALVGGHDEMTPVFAGFMRKAGHVKDGEICSEAAVSVLLSSQPDAPALCTLEGLKLLNEPEPAELADAIRSITGGNVPSAIMTGMSGNSENDSWYGFLRDLLPGVPLLRYKHLFGVNFSSSAIGFYAVACCIKKGIIPACLALDGAPVKTDQGILIVNAVEGRHYSISLLKPICGGL